MNGISFDNIHSYYDLNLILSSCTISPAKPKTNFVDIPGASKSIDLTEALGTVAYNDRSGQLVFSVLPTDDFEKKKSEISNTLNHRFKITLDKDPDYYYVGRCSVNDWKSDKMSRQIVCDLRLQPYKYKQNVTEVEVVTVSSSHKKTFVLKNDAMTVIPTVVVTGTGTSLIINQGNRYQMSYSAGTYVVPEFCLYAGDNTFTIEQTTGQ